VSQLTSQGKLHRQSIHTSQESLITRGKSVDAGRQAERERTGTKPDLDGVIQECWIKASLV